MNKYRRFTNPKREKVELFFLILIDNLKGGKSIGKSGNSWEHNIRMKLKEMLILSQGFLINLKANIVECKLWLFPEIIWSLKLWVNSQPSGEVCTNYDVN